MKYIEKPIANIMRSGLIESQHFGSVVAVDFDGNMVAYYGNPYRKTFLRSAEKPLQAIPTYSDLACMKFFGFNSRERAYMVASHNGERYHQEIGRSVQKKLGITNKDMKCGIHPPLDTITADEMRGNNEPFTELCHNCSGNHMVMIALSKFKGWGIDNYTDPGHPYQQEVLKWVSLFSGVPKRRIGIGSDGCTAPVHYLTLYEMALCFARFSKPERLVELPNPDNLDISHGIKAMKQIMSDYWAHPEIIGGRNRLCTILNRIGRGRFFTKEGGEALHMVGIADQGVGLIVKITDGDALWRVANTVLIETLVQLELITPKEFELIKKEKIHYKPDLSKQVGGRFQSVQPVFKIHKLHGWD